MRDQAVVGEVRGIRFDQLADVFERAVELNWSVAGGGSVKQTRLAAICGFDEYLEAATYEATEEIAAKALGKSIEPGGTPLFDAAIDLVGHGGGGSSLTRAETEDVNLGKSNRFDSATRGLELGIGFAREPDDHVGGEGRRVEGFLDLKALLHEACGSPTTPHALEDRVRTALHGEVQVWADAPRMVGHQGEETTVDLDSFKTGKSKTPLARYCKEFFGQVRETQLTIRPFESPVAEVDAREDDLAMAPVDESADFVHEFLHWATRQVASGSRNDAVAAAHATTVLDLNVGPGAVAKSRDTRWNVENTPSSKELRNLAFVREYLGHAGNTSDDILGHRRVAPHHHDLGIGVFAGEPPDRLAALQSAFTGDRTSVDEAEIGGLIAGRLAEANASKSLGDQFRFVLVDLAAEGDRTEDWHREVGNTNDRKNE